MIARRSFSPYGELMFEAKHAQAKGEIDRARILRDAATKVIERELVGEGFKVIGKVTPAKWNHHNSGFLITRASR